jgi:hypothetical protein
MSKLTKLIVAISVSGIILFSSLNTGFFGKNVQVDAAQFNVSNITLPQGYSLCAVQDNNSLNSAINVSTESKLNSSTNGTKYNLYAVNANLCSLTTTQNSSQPFTFYSYNNHNTNLTINSITAGNPPVLNASVLYPNRLPSYSAPNNNNNSKTFNLCIGSNPIPVTFSIIDLDGDTLIKNTPTTFSATAERTINVSQGAGFVNYTVTPTQQFLDTPNNFTISTTVKEEVSGNLGQILGFGIPTTIQSIVFNSKICGSSSSSNSSTSNIPKSSSSNSIISSPTSSILSSSALSVSTIVSSSSQSFSSRPSLTLSSNVISTSSSSLIPTISSSLISSSTSSTPSSTSSSSNQSLSSISNSPSQVSNLSFTGSIISSSFSSISSCALPTPPNANICLSRTSVSSSSNSNSSLPSDGSLVISNSSNSSPIISSTTSNSSQLSSFSNESSLSLNSQSSSSQIICSSSQSSQSLTDSLSNSSNSCFDPITRTGGSTININGGGVIVISNSIIEPRTQPSIKSNFSIDDPYICGEPIQGQVFSNNLDKVYLVFESTNDSNISYTINPNVNQDGAYQYDTNSITPGSYRITYYAINGDGAQTQRQSFVADIKLKQDCTTSISQNLPDTNEKKGVLDYTYTPVKEDKINVETLTKIAQASQTQVLQKVNTETNSLVRTGGEKTQSIRAIVFLLISVIWLLVNRPKKSFFGNKTRQVFKSLVSLSILTTSISVSGIYTGGNVIYPIQGQNKHAFVQPTFVLCTNLEKFKHTSPPNLTFSYF